MKNKDNDDDNEDEGEGECICVSFGASAVNFVNQVNLPVYFVLWVSESQ